MPRLVLSALVATLWHVWVGGPLTMPHNEQPRLPALAVDPERVSIGGISTGADLAANYLLAHSASTCGAAIWAGNAPRCAVTRFAQDVLHKCRDKAACTWPACDASVRPCPAGYRLDPSKCQGPCPGPFVPHAGDPSRFVGRSIHAQNVTELQAVARRRAAAGKIDDPDRFLKRRRLFAYRGAKDTCYLRGAVDHTASFFEGFDATVAFVNSTIGSRHAIPTVATGAPCGEAGRYGDEGAPFGLEACGYDGAGASLAHIYGVPRAAPSRFEPSSLSRFSQHEFGGRTAGLDLDAGGFLYAPRACRQAARAAASGSADGAAPRPPPCGLHVFVHGCDMEAGAGPTRYTFNDTFARRAGFNEWAVAHHVAVVYPQLASRGDGRPTCWDVMGRTGDNYSDRGGMHVRALRQMVKRLLELPSLGANLTKGPVFSSVHRI